MSRTKPIDMCYCEALPLKDSCSISTVWNKTCKVSEGRERERGGDIYRGLWLYPARFSVEYSLFGVLRFSLASIT